ncbi:MAG: Zn-binding domain-containing protein [Polyangiaceae bacterium]
MLHEQAIYQHDAEQYQVEELDYENHKAYVRRVEPDYFTTAMINRKVSIIEVTAARPLGIEVTAARPLGIELTAAAPMGRALGTWGEVSVVEKVVGYKKIKFYTHENTGYGEVRLPDMQMHTTSFWLTVPEAICLELGMPRAAAVDALRGVGVALETVATLLLMCDPRDIGQTLEPGMGAGGTGAGAALDDPTLFLFDNVPGGVGLAERIWHAAPELLASARQLLLGCACKAGCPLCVGAAPVADALGASRKRAAIRLIELVLHAS